MYPAHFRWTILGMALVWMVDPAWSSPLQEAESAYREGDYKQAVKLVRPAAQKGDSAAQSLLGLMYDRGHGVKHNLKEALAWTRKAAEQGNRRSQRNLGIMYATGRGVTRDDTEAVKWYVKAAAQDDTHGQLNLGFMYDQGRGVAHDDTEASMWYRKAADQGNARAQTQMGLRYLKGTGVLKDAVEASMWLNRASAQGDTDAIRIIQRLNKAIRESRMADTAQLEADLVKAASEYRRQKSVYDSILDELKRPLNTKDSQALAMKRDHYAKAAVLPAAGKFGQLLADYTKVFGGEALRDLAHHHRFLDLLTESDLEKVTKGR